MPVARSTKKVSEKSTKLEIWDEYNKLLTGVEGQTEELPLDEQKPLVNTALRGLSELKIKISEQLESIGDGILGGLNDSSELQNRMKQERQDLLASFRQQREALSTEIAHVRDLWREEEKKRRLMLEQTDQELALSRKREEDEYRYNLSAARRKERDEYSARESERKQQLAEKEKAMKTREEEIAQMENDLTEMPAKTQAAVEVAKSELSKELVSKYTSEIKELGLVHGHEKKLAELKIANLESLSKTQESEIEQLKRQLTESTKQVKEIAVSVIEGRSAAKTNDSQPEPAGK